MSATTYPVHVDADLDTRTQPLAVAVQVAAGHPALHRAGLPVAGLRGAERGGLLRHPVHRPLPPQHLRVQRRRAALELAGGLLRLRCAGHRPVPAVHVARRARLPGTPRGRVSRAPLARPRAGQVVAARHPALHRRGSARRGCRMGRARRERRAARVGRGSDRTVGARRRRHACSSPVATRSSSSTSSSASTAGCCASPATPV